MTTRYQVTHYEWLAMVSDGPRTHQIVLTFKLAAILRLNESIEHTGRLGQVVLDDIVEIIRIEKVQLRRLAIVDAHSDRRNALLCGNS